MKYNGFQITFWWRTLSHNSKLLLCWCLKKCNWEGNQSGESKLDWLGNKELPKSEWQLQGHRAGAQRPSLCSQCKCWGGFPPEQSDVFQEQNRISHEDTNTQIYPMSLSPCREKSGGKSSCGYSVTLMLWLSLCGSQAESVLDTGGRPEPMHSSGCPCRCCLDFVTCKGPLYFVDQCCEEGDPERLWPQSQIQPSKIRFASKCLVLHLLSSICFCSVLNGAWRQTGSVLL